MSQRCFAIVVRRFPLELPMPAGEDYFAEPAHMMAEAGFKVEVLTLRHDQQAGEEEINAIRVRRFCSELALLAAIAKNSYDIIHSHSHFRPALLTGLVSLRARTVFMSHSGELPGTAWKRRALVALMNRFDRIIALTPAEQQVYEVAGVASSKIVVIGHQIDLDFFSQPGDPDKFRQCWNISADAPVILFVANLRRFKNPEVVLRAFGRVRQQLSRAVLVVVGKDMLSQQGHASFAELAQHEGVKENVVMTDWLPAEELRNAIAAAAVSINSSATNEESFSISTWETIAGGRPVCLPRLGTFLSTIGDNVLYHEPFDDVKLAVNILRYLREPELVQAHVAANRAIANKYAMPAGLAKLRALYTSLLEC